MKQSFFKIFAVVALVTFSSCGDNKAKEAETKAAEEAAVAEATAVTYKANTETSTIEWKGFKPTGSHNGTIAISEGNIGIKDGMVESGSFTINMDSIVVLDIPKEDDGNASLTGHLKAPDFFDVAKYPSAKFEITGVETANGKTILSGNLKLKDATNNISFPVTSEVKDGVLTLTSETFTIDRTKWNIKYKSKSIFGDLGDKFINDDIELKVMLVANKA